MSLKRDCEVINRLSVALGPEQPSTALSPDQPVDASLLVGGGPFEFRIPSVRSGDYEVWGGVFMSADATKPRHIERQPDRRLRCNDGYWPMI